MVVVQSLAVGIGTSERLIILKVLFPQNVYIRYKP